jgi:hypothetical protein
MQANDIGGLPLLVLNEPDTLECFLDLAQSLARRYPAMTRAVATALVAEGRPFADTDEGRQWRSVLEDSELVRRGRMLWYVGGLDDLLADAQEPIALPSDWLKVAADALVHTDLEALLSRRLRKGESNVDTSYNPA